MMDQLDCLAVVRQLWDYLDGELTPASWEAMEEHLATCTDCQEHVDFCRSFLQRIASSGIDPIDVESTRRRIEAAIRWQ